LSEKLVSHVDREPDPAWGDDIGVIAYKARSSLDQIVHQLVVDSGNVPSSADYFPIYADADGYLSKGRSRTSQRDRKLQGVASRHRRVIDGLQPYQRGPQARRDPLFVLNAICNQDKHSRPHAVWAAMSGTRFRIVRPDGEEFRVSIKQDDRPRPLVDGQVLLGIDSQPDDGVSKMRLEVDDVRIGVVFAGKVTVSLDQVETALQHVCGIVDRFENRIRVPAVSFLCVPNPPGIGFASQSCHE
jgi:hypothetical protein